MTVGLDAKAEAHTWQRRLSLLALLELSFTVAHSIGR